MHDLWQTLPVPAIRLLPAAAQAGPGWQLNPAAHRLGHAAVLWRQWAEAILQSVHGGTSTGTLADGAGSTCLRWTAGVLEPGWLAWLEPAEAATPAAAAATTDEVVRQLRQRLDITQRFGRLGIWERDVRTGQGQWDRYIYGLYGLDPDAGTPTMEQAAQLHFHPDDAQRAMDTWHQSIRQPGQYELHFRLYTREGRLKSLHSMWEVINGADGQPERAIGVLLDDTESIELAQLHQASSLQLDLAVRLGGIVVWRRDLDSDVVHLSEWGYRLLGLPYSEEGMSAEELANLVHPDDKPAVKQATQRALEYPEAVDVEARYRRADGVYLTALSRRVAVRDANGKPVALLGVNLDLTERRAAEEQLRSIEQRARLATLAVGMGTWEHRPGSGGIYWDDQMYRLRGLEPGGPQPPAELHAASLHPADRERALERLEAALHGSGEAYEDEYRVVWPDGRVRWLAARGMPQAGLQGRIAGMLGVNWDITDYKQAEQALRDKAAAEQASRAKSEFLARVSHELRTPLNAVLGFTRLLATDAEHPLRETQQQRIAIVETAGAHLLALINDTLDLASIEAGTLPLDNEPVRLAPVLAQALQWAQPAAARAGVNLEVLDCEAVAQGDARRLRQVFINLLTNAIKYNRPGGSVAVRLLPVSDPAWLAVEVRDTGRGLTPAQMNQLFEPFNRLGAELEDIEGTGIGLTIVHHLVERMGGAIVVDSEPGVGSCFTVWLPAATAGAGADEGSHHDQPHRQPAPGATLGVVADGSAADTNMGKTLDVLYIEDNGVNVLLVEELVALRPGWILHVADTGESGVRKALDLHPSVVLVDMQLPDFDGFEVLRRLRGQAGLESCRFIALSANAMPEDIAVAREAGFHDYWTKPIDFGQFLGGLDALAAQA